MISRTLFETTPEGLPAYTYTLAAGSQEVVLTDFGAAITSISIPDAAGKKSDIVLGFDKLEDYFDNPACYGMTVGPSANRTDKAEVPLAGHIYHLPKNDGPTKQNNLHTDLEHGLHKRLWDTEIDEDANSVVFSLRLDDGTFGLPGNRSLHARYTLKEIPEGAELLLTYSCTSDMPTLVNMTNHTYFNLSGHDCGTVRNHLVQIAADTYLPLREDCVSQGVIAPVAETPFDFRAPKYIGKDIDADNEQIHRAHGYDHCFCIDGYTPQGDPRLALLATGTKAELTILLTTPGAHFYTGNWLGDINAKDGAVYGPNDGFAFEPEFYPDFIHHPAWSQPCCDADHPYIESIVYRIRPRKESVRA